MKLYRKKQYVGKVYPTGEYTLGYDIVSYTKERHEGREYERAHALQYHELRDENEEPFMKLPLDVAQVYCPGEVRGQEEKLALGLSTVRNSRKRGKYGGKGITSEGRRKVKASAYLLEQRYGRRRLSFATITIPPLNEGDRRWLHEHWNVFTNRIIEEIKRELKRNGYPAKIVAVTEIQEKRFKKTGEIYLHLHLVWVGIGHRNVSYGIRASWLRERLGGVLRNILGEYWAAIHYNAGDADIPTSAAVDIQRVKKSVASYLGKYLSKGGRLRSSEDYSSDDPSLPRQWWYTTRDMKKWLAASMQCLPHDECDRLMNEPGYRESCTAYAVDITLILDDIVYRIGQVGKYLPNGKYHLSKTLIMQLCPE